MEAMYSIMKRNQHTYNVDQYAIFNHAVFETKKFYVYILFVFINPDCRYFHTSFLHRHEGKTNQKMVNSNLEFFSFY